MRKNYLRLKISRISGRFRPSSCRRNGRRSVNRRRTSVRQLLKVQRAHSKVLLELNYIAVPYLSWTEQASDCSGAGRVRRCKQRDFTRKVTTCDVRFWPIARHWLVHCTCPL